MPPPHDDLFLNGIPSSGYMPQFNGTSISGSGIHEPFRPKSRSAVLSPGIYFDEAHRVFRLRCKTSMYAFRVDDAKNLEHLYWGPALPMEDNILYLTKSHVPAPFDPVGAVSVAKVLGLKELERIEDVGDILERWKVFTRQKDADEGDGQGRGRRLENASWRLWHMERNRGGDLNRDLSDGTVASAIQLNPKSKGSSGPGTPGVPISASSKGDPTNVVPPATLPPSAGIPPPMRKGMAGSRSVGNVVDLERIAQMEASSFTEPSEEIGVAAKQELMRSSSNLSASPHLRAQHASSAALSSLGADRGSTGDLAHVQDWRKLDSETVGKNTKLLEYSDFGTGDYREPSFRVKFADGSTICPLEYKKHRILAGKHKPPMPPPLPGIRSETKDESTTLIVDMFDSVSKCKIQLYYTVMHDYDIIVRRAVATNEGKRPISLQHLAAGTVDFDAEYRFYMTQLCGGWARERQILTQKLEDGCTLVKSTRGASSHQANPFVVITPEREPSEDDGECFGFCFVYSGNFSIAAEVSETNRLRVNVGINPEGFTWLLEPTDDMRSFSTPELIMTYSDQGLGTMSRDMHRLIRERLIPKRWRYHVPPVLLNTWEAVYFDVSHEVVVDIARAAAAANIELLVLDDGWFGRRDNIASGLGDWTPNPKKLPYGLDGLARAVNNFGLQFGLWIEPEMVSIESELFKAHEEWCLCVPWRSRTTGRNQLVLDFSREDVRNYIYECIHSLLTSANIQFVKWDMNRHLTEVFSQACDPERQGEIAHRFILGVYEVLARLAQEFPDVLVETCSGGGGRFDAGMLAFAPQIWASDNTDALSRVKIQYGTSLAYPASAMGAHISSIPNHQTLRSTTMKTRSLVAMTGTYGYELDPRGWKANDIDEIQGYIKLQKRIAPLVYEGDMYRLWSPFKSDSAAWMFISRDKMRAIVMAINVRREVGRLEPRLRLRGLLYDAMYCVEELCPGTVVRNIENGAIDNDPRGVYQFGRPMTITGHTLCHAGLPVKFLFDADSVVFELNAVGDDGRAAFM